MEDLYDAVRTKILLGQVEPGARLALSDIAEEQGVSLGVVREAATRLASEGLVQASPQQGFRVRSVSVPDLIDLTWIRLELESPAIRRSIENGGLAWEAELVAAHHMLALTPIQTDEGTINPAWAAAHSEFHTVLASACESPILIRIRQQLFDASEVYRYWSARAGGAPHRDVVGEHTQILEAALARDADRAVEVHAAHLTETTRRLIESQSMEPQP